ncbi:DUF1460 domain-containing protein [Pseudomonas sp. Fl5BN2]|uniref:DUF1460 domain-containing protein n=1 Tax=unclassified Pseudomonas TaxID=196821 RepID=UPI001377D9C9|nr:MULTISPECIES: DUF1460 domain-containing protein [unclassified Pseudomonas]NBF01804.1 DUF1460 domain-containing protein [Pseudomonas sp. Fl5BN2]NBF07296.1 DUF1460 domain-containing protein [Pseudomonas sp. Fl4BN1]
MNKAAVFFLASVLAGCANPTHVEHKTQAEVGALEDQRTQLEMDTYTAEKLTALLKVRNQLGADQPGQLSEQISREFMHTPYAADMLQGSASMAEKLVVDFRGLDCFTYMDYVETLRKSTDQDSFIKNLIQTRYVNTDVQFANRRHFFTDWAYAGQPLTNDLTAQLSAHSVTVTKKLNQKADGDLYLPGLPLVERDITYIPSSSIDEKLLSRLKTGDYIGIYTHLPGLDVTHTGLFIQTAAGPVLRNASSKKMYREVMDAPFMEYVQNIPGIVVLRTRQDRQALEEPSVSETGASSAQHPDKTLAHG